jgi:hypothetical protein
MDYKEFLLDELTNKLEIGLNGKLLSKKEIEEKKIMIEERLSYLSIWDMFIPVVAKHQKSRR